MLLLSQALFFLILLASFSGFISPPVALTLGIVLGLSFAHPFAAQSRRTARILLQVSVVALGFGMNLHQVLKAGSSGFVYTAAGIAFAFIVGLSLGKLLHVRGNSSFLITTGTAICGGSAIAAVGPILQADDEEMAVSLGTIFILNSVALFLFPPIGRALHFTQTQFGLWAALAIHDTSSVVGASSKYGAEALIVGTTVKLARALWIVPLALATAAYQRRVAVRKRDAGETVSVRRVPLPWFIVLFLLAAVFNTYLPAYDRGSSFLFMFGRLGLTATLFLIGTGISRRTLRDVGWRPMLQGLLLWLMVASVSVYCIRAGIISL